MNDISHDGWLAIHALRISVGCVLFACLGSCAWPGPQRRYGGGGAVCHAADVPRRGTAGTAPDGGSEAAASQGSEPRRQLLRDVYSPFRSSSAAMDCRREPSRCPAWPSSRQDCPHLRITAALPLHDLRVGACLTAYTRRVLLIQV